MKLDVPAVVDPSEDPNVSTADNSDEHEHEHEHVHKKYKTSVESEK